MKFLLNLKIKLVFEHLMKIISQKLHSRSSTFHRWKSCYGKSKLVIRFGFWRRAVTSGWNLSSVMKQRVATYEIFSYMWERYWAYKQYSWNWHVSVLRIIRNSVHTDRFPKLGYAIGLDNCYGIPELYDLLNDLDTDAAETVRSNRKQLHEDVMGKTEEKK